MIQEVFMIEEKREQLLKLYEKWYSELKKICPQFICEEFSHPYYLHIPDEWYERKCRILIVGEEGHGKHKFDDSIEDAQIFNREYLACQLGQYSKDYNRNTSPFWNRIRGVAKLAKSDDLSITWTNIDKIHCIGSGRGACVLSDDQRRDLHKTPTKILAEEIKLLQPNVVVFCGWHNISLEEQLPEVDRKRKQHDAENASDWIDNKIITLSERDISYILTYHPGYNKKPKGYEEKVLLKVKSIIDKILTENH